MKPASAKAPARPRHAQARVRTAQLRCAPGDAVPSVFLLYFLGQLQARLLWGPPLPAPPLGVGPNPLGPTGLGRARGAAPSRACAARREWDSPHWVPPSQARQQELGALLRTRLAEVREAAA